jgi:hypothetical protein
MFRRYFAIGISLVAVGILMILPGRAAAQVEGIVDRIAEMGAEVDWTDMEIIIRGIGAPPTNVSPAQRRPMAIRAAKADALRNLLEVTKGVEVNSETTVESAIVTSDVIRTKVSGLVQGARVDRTKYMSDGSVEVYLKMLMDGELMDVVIPDTEWKVPKVEPVSTGGTPPPPPPPPPPPKPGEPTGLIVDCRGLKVKPALAPNIVSETGENLYGTEFLSEEVGDKEGIVWFCKTLDAAKINKDRVGTNPMIVRAVKAQGKNMCDVVVPKDAADKLKAIGQDLSFLDECNVAFVID